MKKICIVTGTRAEYGLLKPIMDRINNDNNFKLQLVVTGMHLSPEFGLTYKEIIEDGFIIDEKIEILLSSDTHIGISKSMGLAMISFAEAYERLKPDIAIVLGDRYEIFSAASAASVARIPIVHLYGGETTEGVIDEAFRHSITKMSLLHFTSTETYRQRVIQLGEHPSRVFNVGAMGIENIKNIRLLRIEELESLFNFKFEGDKILLTFHPVTLENKSSKEQFQNLLDALDKFENLKVIFTKANSDTDGRIINKMIDKYVEKNRHRAIAFTSMGQQKYLSTMKYIDAVVGNSSSGIVEAPSFNVPTINIGDRQKGRIQADSILNCEPNTDEIAKLLKTILCKNFKKNLKNIKNPYGDGDVSRKIVEKIKLFLLDDAITIKKKFYDTNRELI